MAEYIDIDGRVVVTDTRGRERETTVRNILEMNKGVYTTADVRPVVLCRDCIHLSGVTNGGSFFRCDRYDRWQDESNRVYMPLDGFCCYGQKKQEES